LTTQGQGTIINKSEISQKFTSIPLAFLPAFNHSDQIQSFRVFKLMSDSKMSSNHPSSKHFRDISFTQEPGLNGHQRSGATRENTMMAFSQAGMAN
jgi:hypothetical protein